jgi:hypothetical protein
MDFDPVRLPIPLRRRGVAMECWCDNLTRAQLLSTPLLNRHQIGRSQTARRPENFANNDRVAQTRF